MLSNTPAILAKLNEILEYELAGVVRYTHYSFMVFGFGRIPIVGWFRGAASETLTHAHRAGELITHLGGHPTLGIGRMLETSRHEVRDILEEALAYERNGLVHYYDLLALVEQEQRTATLIMLEEYARQLIAEEEAHIGDIDKMLRVPGTLESVI